MTSRPDLIAPETHIPNLGPVEIEILLSMYGPQFNAMQEDPNKGYFFVDDVHKSMFERFQQLPILEIETMVMRGVLQYAGEGAGVPANSVRISLPIMRAWNQVRYRAAQLNQSGERLKPKPARRSTTSLALKFDDAPLPTPQFAAPAGESAAAMLQTAESMLSTPAPLPSEFAAPAAAATSTLSTPPTGIEQDETAGLPKELQAMHQDFESQLSAVNGKGSDLANANEDLKRLKTGKKGR